MKAKRTFSLLLCLAVVFSYCMVCASAVRECKASEIQGLRTNTYDEFYVTTGSTSKPKITLKQEKGCFPFEAMTKYGPFSACMYGYASYHVKVYAQTSSGYEKVKSESKDWTGKTHTIKLEKNTKYKIVTTPYDDTNWEDFPTWKISSSKGISKFEFSFTCQ